CDPDLTEEETAVLTSRLSRQQQHQQQSSALLSGCEKMSPKRQLSSDQVFVYIDFATVFNDNGDGPLSGRRAAVLEQFDAHLPVEFERHCLTAAELLPGLSEALAAMTDGTGYRELLHRSVHRCLALASRQFNCSRVLTGETASRLAELTLRSVAQGRLSADSGAFSAIAAGGVCQVRPLRQLTSAETALLSWLAADGLMPVCPRPADPDSPLLNDGQGGGSIPGVIASFLGGLQQSFPATVYNILRTGEKLQSDSVAAGSSSSDSAAAAATPCPACGLSMQQQPSGDDGGNVRSNCNALRALRLSENLARSGDSPEPSTAAAGLWAKEGGRYCYSCS
uniref:Cytoplasmic tRNA 2-thiolation protein 2 n=1 Tax=Macrostomum lignano TaxID=282301 RepID=A0A1I8JN08_9PLAT